MDRNPNALKQPRPPRLAEALIGVLSQKHIRDALLGDLAEEFDARSAQSQRSAWFWYWGQAALSCRHLLYARVTANRHHNILAGILVSLLGTLFILTWDILVSRNSARLIATLDSAPTLTVIRGVYFLVLGLGAALCGMVIARVFFSRKRTFWRNATLYFAPIFLALASSSMLSAIERGLAESSVYLLMRAGLIGLATLMAAALVYYRTQSR